MKIKILTAAFVTLALLNSIALAQVNEPVLDLKNEVIMVEGNLPSGKEERFVDITVLNPGFTASDISNAESLQYKETVKSGENGFFSFSIAINNGLLPKDDNNFPKAGEFTIIINGDDGNLDEKKLYFAPAAVREEIINELIKSENSSILADLLEKYKKDLGIDTVLFNSVKKQGIADIMFSKLPTLNLTYKNAQEIIAENALLAAFNEGKTDILYKDGKFLYETIMKIDTLDADKNCTVKNLFDNEITQSGKAAVVNNMCGKNLTTADELIALFASETILKSISDPVKSGYGVISEILTSKNAELAGLDIVKYASLTESEKTEVNKLIVKKSFSDIANLQKYIDDTCDNIKDKANGSSSESSSGSPVGGGNSSTVKNPSFVSNITENNKGANISPPDIFTDLNDAEWAREAVEQLAQKGIVNGVGDSRFNPSGIVTREQLAKILCLGFEYEITDKECEFSDVDAGMWYAPFVSTLNNEGIVKGFDKEIFGVGSSVTRQDMAVMIYRILGEPDVDAVLDFNDSVDVSEYAQKAVAYLVEKGIINGFEDNTFRPKDNCTRAQAAKIVYDALNAR